MLELFRRGTIGLVGSGVVASGIAAVLAWPTARSGFGSFRGLLTR